MINKLMMWIASLTPETAEKLFYLLLIILFGIPIIYLSLLLC